MRPRRRRMEVVVEAEGERMDEGDERMRVGCWMKKEG